MRRPARPLTPGCVSLHPYLDLGDTGGLARGAPRGASPGGRGVSPGGLGPGPRGAVDPYGPMSGSHLASHSLANVASVAPDTCGPLSK